MIGAIVFMFCYGALFIFGDLMPESGQLPVWVSICVRLIGAMCMFVVGYMFCYEKIYSNNNKSENNDEQEHLGGEEND